MPSSFPGAHGDAAGAHRQFVVVLKGHRASAFRSPTRNSSRGPRRSGPVTATPCRTYLVAALLFILLNYAMTKARHVGRASAQRRGTTAGKVTNAMPTIVQVARARWTGGCRHAGGGGRRRGDDRERDPRALRSAATTRVVTTASGATTTAYQPTCRTQRRRARIHWIRALRLAPTWTRTKNLPVNSRLLCQLSYGGKSRDRDRVALKLRQKTGRGTKRRRQANPWLPTRALGRMASDHAPDARAGSLADRSKLQRFAWLSIAAALATIVLKTGAWWMTGSVGLLSDAAESTVNLVAAIRALFALRIAARPADETHHYGHTKAEFFSAAAEGTMIFVAAAVIWSAIQRIIEPPQPLENVGIGLGISVLASVVNGLVAWCCCAPAASTVR